MAKLRGVSREHAQLSKHTRDTLAAENTDISVGQRIKFIREIVDMSQGKFGELTGVNQSTVSNWEKGRDAVGLGSAVVLKMTYGIPLDFIYFGDVGDLPKRFRDPWEAKTGK